MQQEWFNFIVRVNYSQKNDRFMPFLSNYSCISYGNGLNVSSTKIVLDSLQTGHDANDAQVAARFKSECGDLSGMLLVQVVRIETLWGL
jgi:hypothetical protein